MRSPVFADAVIPLPIPGFSAWPAHDSFLNHSNELNPSEADDSFLATDGIVFAKSRVLFDPN